MNQKILSIAGVVVVALIILVVVGLRIWNVPQPSGTSTQANATSTASIGGDVGSPTVTSPKPASSAQTSAPISGTKNADTMTALPLYGTIPFSVSFVLNLNSDLTCDNNAYILSFGDNTQEYLQVPQDACAKPYQTKVSHQYTRAGTFTATLSYKLIGGSAGQELGHIKINAQNQSVTVGKTSYGTFTISPPAGTVPLEINVTLSATDSKNTNGINYTVSFGDGETETFPQTALPSLTHTYTNLGSYFITVNRRTECVAGTCTGPSTSLGSYNISVH